MTVNTEHMTDWQDGRQPGPPWSSCSPNLQLIVAFLISVFGGAPLGCYGLRPVRGGRAWSSHSFGAASDWRWFVAGAVGSRALVVWQKASASGKKVRERAARRVLEVVASRLSGTDVLAARLVLDNEVLPWLIRNSEELGVQAIHDYYNARIWRAVRDGEPAGWKSQPVSASTGMGQSWAQWIHVETHENAWSWTTPIADRRLGSPVPLPRPTLRRGDVGSGVVKLRAILADEGLLRQGARTRAVFGRQVERAVRTMQTRLSVPVTGVWDQVTADAYRKVRG